MTARKVTVSLTEKQFGALASGIGLALTTMEQDGPESIGLDRYDNRAMHDAWSRLYLAWQEAR